MNAGLWLLLRRSAYGRVRQVGRRMRTVKGALTFGSSFVFLGAIVGAQVWASMLPETQAVTGAAVEDVRRMGPPALVVLTLLGFVTGRALYFTPAEVDFLYPAPLGRRQLLAYNLVSRLGVQVFSALWTALFVLRWAPSAAYGLAALVLAFVFIYVTAQALGVAAAAAGAYLPPAARRIARIGIGAALVLVVIDAAAKADPAAGVGGRVRAVVDADAVRAISIVTRPFGELFVASQAGAALGWLALCVAIIAAEVALVMAFDAASTERALVVSRRAHERMQRARSGGGVYLGAAPGGRRLRAPDFAFLGRAAPLARRQLTELMRNPRALVPAFLMSSVWMVAIVTGARGDGAPSGGEEVAVLMGMGVIFPVVFTAHLPFDFRRDVDRMPLLRSLPLSPTAVAVGQIFPVALLFVAVQLMMVGLVAATMGGVPPAWLAALALGLPGFSWAALALDNALFLLMPYRVSTAGEPNMQFLGKTMMAMFLKLLVLGILTGIAVLAAWSVQGLTGSALAAIVAGAVVLAAGCVPLTWAVGQVFAAFDVGRDVPA